MDTNIARLLANPRLKEVASYQPGKPIEELERELGIQGAVKMASNENPFGPSPLALKAIKRVCRNINRYPDAGCFYLKKALSRKFKQPTDRIIVGNGSDELIVLAIRTFANANDEVLMAKPTFLIYRIAALVQGAMPVEVPMRNFKYDLGAMAERITPKTKIIFIANPDNPMGTYVTDRELRLFVRKVPQDCLIFIDEAYYEFGCIKKDFPRSLEFLEHHNVIVSRSFSKAYGLSGLRIGYAFSRVNVAEAINKVREPFNVNVIAQTAGESALEDSEFIRNVVRTTEKEKKRLKKAIEKLGMNCIESATNFLCVHCGRQAAGIYDALLREGVIVRHLSAWGLDEYIRVTIGKPEENLLFMSKLGRVLKKIKGEGKH